MGVNMKFTKRFFNAGWLVLPAYADLGRGLGSAIKAFIYRGPSRFGTWRIAAGKRISRIEKRVHDTPTGRCSRGRWVTEWKGDSPRTTREWSEFAEFAAWYVSVSPEEREGWTWTDYRGNDHNRCLSKPHHGRGRKVKNLPGYEKTAGYSPASGRKAATHAPAKVRSAKLAAERHAKNLLWLAEANAKDARIIEERDRRIAAKRAASALFGG